MFSSLITFFAQISNFSTLMFLVYLVGKDDFKTARKTKIVDF